MDRSNLNRGDYRGRGQGFYTRCPKEILRKVTFMAGSVMVKRYII
jgi:hypothetical protein